MEEHGNGAKPRKGRKQKAEQTELKGMERKRIADIEKAANDYAETRDERMELTEAEVQSQGKLLATMRKHNLTKYRLDDGRVVRVEEGEAKVKVTKPKDVVAATP